jgi:hypothetical protein
MRRAGHVSGEARILGYGREESRHHSTQSLFWEERRHLEAGRTILVNWVIVLMHWCFGREERENRSKSMKGFWRRREEEELMESFAYALWKIFQECCVMKRREEGENEEGFI